MPLIRPVKALSSADRGREVLSARPPAGGPIRLYQARIAREQQRLAPLLGVRGTVQAQQRGAIRRVLRKAQAGLERAEQEQAAGTADRRGTAARIRDRQRRRGPAGGPVVNLTDPQARLMVEGSAAGRSRATTARSCALMTTQ